MAILGVAYWLTCPASSPALDEGGAILFDFGSVTEPSGNVSRAMSRSSRLGGVEVVISSQRNVQNVRQLKIKKKRLRRSELVT